MDLDALQEKWKEHDRKLDLSIRLNRQLLRETKINQTQSALKRLLVGLSIEAVIDFLPLIPLGSFLYDHRLEWQFFLPALVLHLLAIANFGTLIRQIVLIQEIDYSNPVIVIQKQLETLRIVRIRHIQAIFLCAVLLWPLMLIVGMKGLLGLDAYRLLGPNYLIVNILAGIAIIPLALALSRRFSKRLRRLGFLQSLMRDLAGQSLNRANEFLATLSEFEAENAHL